MSTPTTPAPAGDEPAVLADWLRRIAGDPELILASAERLKMRNAAAALERLAERVVRLEAALETAADEAEYDAREAEALIAEEGHAL